MRQYLDIKKNYADSILLFRLGDFYEMFGEDAKKASKALDIYLTSRQFDEDGNRIPMAGVPYHAVESYLVRLVKSGFKVAICEQLEDPKLAKGIVKRDVIRVITPGTLVEDSLLPEKANNFIASIVIEESDKHGLVCGVAFADISTGEFFATQINTNIYENLKYELIKFQPSEIIVPETLKNEQLNEVIKNTLEKTFYHDYSTQKFTIELAKEAILRQFNITTIESLGIANSLVVISSAGALLQYLAEMGKTTLPHIYSFRFYISSRFMVLDATTLRNLEILKNIRDGTTKATLFEHLDECVTKSGSRLLRKLLTEPLMEISEINARLDGLDFFIKNKFIRRDVRTLLKGIHDIERLASRIATKNATPKDLLALKQSLAQIPQIKKVLQNAECGMRNAELMRNVERGVRNADLAPGTSHEGLITKLINEIDDFTELRTELERAIREDAGIQVKEGKIIKMGYSAELDRLINIAKEGHRWIIALEKKERERTGIPKLKIGYNTVFGYYIEVTKANVHLVPKDYIRKQTLVNAERYITEELKTREEEILNASEKTKALEYELFCMIRDKVAGVVKDIIKTAQALAFLDVLTTFAEISEKYRYTRPQVTENGKIIIRGGKHPVIERYIQTGFVPNDTLIDCDSNRLLILTGPNMAGKSTYMRQVALTVLLAQLGCYVPAEYASIGIVDRIFTRVGAYDDIALGQSTFMIEMVELASILNSASQKSLILLDEIGRGTSTFDGLSIAWAVTQYVHSKLKCRTLLATHYHQLTELASQLNGVKNYHFAVKEDKDNIVFLRKLLPGATDRSYGIQVAKLAGLPEKIIRDAMEFLKKIEKTDILSSESTGKKYYTQMLLPVDIPEVSHPVIEELKNLNLDQITPMEALMKLNELKKKLQK